MSNQDIVIIALVALVVYLYWQQTQSKPLSVQPNNQEIQELKQQVQHYQTLYQKRVEKDLGEGELVKLYQQKISDLEKQLLSLAQQKLKGKKEFQELMKQLEQIQAEEKKTIFENYEKEKQKWQKDNEVHQEQLRKINLLFDSASANYETIDFFGLYSLLEKVKAEREREREINHPPIFSRKKKKKR